MSYEQNAATNHVPIFGVPGTVEVATSDSPITYGSAKGWDITGIQVSDGNDLVEHRDAAGMIVSRTHFNRDGSGNNRSKTITITFFPVGADAATALSGAAVVPTGTRFRIASSTVPGANGVWECTGYSCSGTNVDNVTGTLTGVWHCENA